LFDINFTLTDTTICDIHSINIIKKQLSLVRVVTFFYLIESLIEYKMKPFCFCKINKIRKSTFYFINLPGDLKLLENRMNLVDFINMDSHIRAHAAA